MNEKFCTSKYLVYTRRNDGYAVYHSISGGLCIIDKNIKKLLDTIGSPKSEREITRLTTHHSNDQINSFIDIFHKKGFLIHPDTDEYEGVKLITKQVRGNLHKGSQIGIVQLVMTNVCNFKCKYCFVDEIYCSEERKISQSSDNNRIMSFKNARSYLETAIELIKNNGKESVSVQFFGGEPLVNWKAIKLILDHFKRGEKYNLEINYSIVTNGSLISDEVARYCRKYEIPVIVSFDSPKGDDRIFLNGHNSFKRIKAGLVLLKKYGNRVAFNAVLSNETFNYFDHELVDFAFKHFIFEIGVLLDLNPAFYKAKKTREIVDRLWNVYLYGQQKGVSLTGYWHSTFQRILERDAIRAYPYKTCSATGAQLSIEPSGDVFACKGSSGYFGNIKEVSGLLSSGNYRKYAQRNLQNAKECIGCEIEFFCSGFCLGPLEKTYNDIRTVEKETCKVYKLITKRLIRDIDTREVETYNMPATVP